MEIRIGDRVWVERAPFYKEKGTVSAIYGAGAPTHWSERVDVRLDGHLYDSSWDLDRVSKLNAVELIAEL